MKRTKKMISVLCLVLLVTTLIAPIASAKNIKMKANTTESGTLYLKEGTLYANSKGYVSLTIGGYTDYNLSGYEAYVGYLIYNYRSYHAAIGPSGTLKLDEMY